MTQTLLAPADLSTADRCDRCGAQEVQDGTAAINGRPSPAAY